MPKGSNVEKYQKHTFFTSLRRMVARELILQKRLKPGKLFEAYKAPQQF